MKRFWIDFIGGARRAAPAPPRPAAERESVTLALEVALLVPLFVFLPLLRGRDRPSGPCPTKGSIPLTLILIFALVAPAIAQIKPDRAGLENADKRSERGANVSGPERAAGLVRLRDEVPDVEVDFDSITGAPQFIRSRSGFLFRSGPGAGGPAAGGNGNANAALAAAESATRSFLDRHSSVFGHGAAVLNGARVRRGFLTAHNRLRTLVWQQELEGLPVADAVLVAHCTENNELVSISSQFVADPARAADRDAPARGQLVNAPPIPLEQAVVRAARNLGDDVKEIGLQRQPANDGARGLRRERLTAQQLPGVIYGHLTWLPIAPDRLRLCWEILLTSKVHHETFKVLVDAQTGEVWVRQSLTAYDAAPQFRVYTSDSPSPFSPGHASPQTNQPPLTERVLVTTNGLMASASPGGWISDGQRETRGNNVEAHTDSDDDDLPDLPRPNGGPNRVFDFPLDLTQPPSSYAAASVVQLFYWCNWMHDRLYELGFDEAAGNFQADNFGHGGEGDDPVQADAQDGGGVNNANMSTLPDGISPRMQMYLFTDPRPARDGALDAEVILHEYTHGLSNRRVGGGVGISRLQSAGMGEGWSDFYGLALLSEAGDDLDGAYAAGGYLTYQLSGLQENYYFGIRRYPYSTDLTKNPLTFKDIDPTQAVPHDGVSRSPLNGPFSPSFASEVHSQGEVWCSMLWEVRANLIRKHGFAAGNRLTLQLVTDGMNLSPANPNFAQARDAILLADRVGNFSTNQREIWAGFAKRGLGASATSPASSTTTGVREAFDPADPMVVRPVIDWTVTRRGNTGFDASQRVYTLSNPGPATVEWTAHYSRAWLQVVPDSGTLSPRGPAQQVVVKLANSALGLPPGIHLDTILFSNSVTHVAQPRAVIAQVSASDSLTEVFASGENDLSFTTFTFTPDDMTGGYTVCRSSATSFPTDPTGNIVTVPEDGAVAVTLAGGANVKLFGLRTNVFFIGSNGYLTMGSADSNGFAYAFGHFDRPRISAMFDDLDPTAGGRITWRQSSNLVAVTFVNVPEYFGTVTNSFQVEWFFDGRIRLTYLRVGSDGIVGLSAGSGVPTPFLESDFSTYPSCSVPSLRLTLPVTVVEGAADLTGSVQLPVAAVTDLTVSLSSTDSSELGVPASVVIPAGQTEASFSIVASDDSRLDGAQPVLVRAAASGYQPATANVEVLDNETTSLQVQLPSVVTEGAGAITGRVVLAQAPAASVVVRLSASHTNKLFVPASVVVPAGATGVDWTAVVRDDIRIDGSQTVVVTARVENWGSAQTTLSVRDNESTNLLVEVPARVREGAGQLSGVGTVRLGGVLDNDLTVALDSSDHSELVVPVEVIIPKGRAQATFDLTVIDDGEVDGLQVLQVTASAPNFGPANSRVEVLDAATPYPAAFPTPPDLASNVTVTADLAWSGGEYDELMTNFGFEEGTFRGWTQEESFYGSFTINTATNRPPGGSEITPPFAGNFSAVATQVGPGRHELFQAIVLPATSGELVLRWADRVHNSYSAYNSSQEYRVEIRNTNDAVLAVAHRTEPGDPLNGSWTSRQFDLAPFAGQTIRVAFVVNPGLNRLEVHVDEVSVSLRNPGTTEFEVFFGRNPQPGAAERLGTTTNTFWVLSDLVPATTYYWQVHAMTRGRVVGPVWQFTTAGVKQFAWETIASPQRTHRPIPVRLSAQDARGSIVSNFTGSVQLSASAGTTSLLLFGDDFEDGNFDGWERNSDYGNWTVTTSTAAVGRNSISLVGGRQSHRDGISHPLPNLQPDVVSFYVRTLRADAGGAYVTLGTGPDVDDLAVYFAVGLEGRMGVYEDASQGHRIPYQPGQWYHIELFFSWTNRTLDYSVDGILRARGIPFRRPEVPYLSQIYLYNFDYTQSWWDDIQLLQTNAAVLLPVIPERTTTFIDGVWLGEVVLAQPGRVLSLRADDGAGHVGTSGAFDVVKDDELAVWITQEPEPASLLTPIRYQVHVFNPGPAAMNDVVVSNTLPPGVLMSFSSTAGQCSAENGKIRCDLGTLMPGAQAEVVALLKATNYGRFTCSTTVNARTGSDSTVVPYLASIVTTVAPPLLEISDATVVEGNFGRTDAVFPVTLSASNPLPVVVQFATSNVNAVAGTDYIPADGMLVFPPGTTQQVVRVPVLGDSVREPHELFTVHLRFASNATLGRAHANGIILDDDTSAVATLPFTENWESGTVRPFWLTSGTGAYRVGLSRSNQPHGGAFHMQFDNGQDSGENARGELTLTINLAGASNVVLRFWPRSGYLGLTEGPPPSPFIGGADFDGVAVSMDGVRWYEVESLRFLSTLDREWVVPLDKPVAERGLSFNSEFRIRFNSVNRYAAPLSGLYLDDISITADQPKIQPVKFAVISQNCGELGQPLSPGETVTMQFWLTNSGAMPVRQLTATLLPTNNVNAPSDPQYFGALTAGSPAMARPFTFTVGGLCGATVAPILLLADAGIPLGRVQFEMPIGRIAAYQSAFSQPAPVLIPSNGPALPFPSTILVSGATGLVQKLVVRLEDFSHPLPDQVDILLRGPRGQTVTLLSDTGGLLPVNHVTLTFDGTSTNRLPDNGQILSGVYNPTNHGSPDAYPAPAPPPPYGTSLDLFQNTNPNGPWELFVLDDTLRDGGSIGSWSLAIDTQQIECCGSQPSADLYLFVDSSPHFVALGENTTFVASAYNRGPDTAAGIILSNLLPQGVTFLSVTSTVGTCTFDAGLVRCMVDTLASNELVNVFWTVRADAVGLLPHDITVAQQTREVAPADNAVSAIVAVSAPGLSIQATSGTEGPGTNAVVRFVVSVNPNSRTSLVSFVTADVTAVAGVDYQATNGILTYLPGETSKTINVRILDDNLDEVNETFTLSLFNPVNVSLSTTKSTGTIVDNDNAPTMSIFDATVTEGDAGLSQAQFRIQLSGASGQQVGANFATANGSASAPTDYVSTNGSVLLVPGETSRILPVFVRGDRLNESAETFLVNLTSPFNATLADAQAAGSILNDDFLPTFTVQRGPLISENCVTTNGWIDAGETVTLQFAFRNIVSGTARANNLVATLLPGGGVVDPGPAQLLGSVAPGATVEGQFGLTAGTYCGGKLTATFALNDGGIDLGTVSVPLTVGAPIVAFTENFDGITAPALPPGWSAFRIGTNLAWRTTTTSRDTIPNAVMADNPATRSTNDLISPPIAINTFQAQLTFRHRFNTESNWDGGVLEISIQDEPFVDFLAAGGHFLEGGYNGRVLFSDSGWTGNSGNFTTVVALLPPTTEGQTVRFRWRFLSDSSTGGVGWFVDSISVTDGYSCCGSPPPLLTDIVRTGQLVTLQWTTIPGRQYRVQYKSRLDNVDWSDLPGDVMAEGISSARTDSLAPDRQRFYRVLLLP
jgi:uncharacterized repeat protein (TIGR01451 family)